MTIGPPVNLVILSLLMMVVCKDIIADVNRRDGATKFRLMLDRSNSLHTFIRNYKFVNHCSEKQIELIGNSVTALGNPDSPNSNLIIQTAHYKNLHGFHIIGQKNGRYLCFNKRSKLILKFSGTSARCIFEEKLSPEYFTKLNSVYNRKWFIGFNSKGKPILGSDTMSHKNRCFYFTKRGGRFYLDGLHENRNYGPKIPNPYKLAHLLREQKIRRRKRHSFISSCR
ncbi:fibroblast growth factor 17 [Nephila pilipes]|uniref:Fibroblast growth factor 17 n=1 Tax=Nephila pilipes TaxID=299642 RepID=A0A8X6P4A3_NEPPI|nr:fibroblast growth factor 17 [Nephila pilipes]